MPLHSSLYNKSETLSQKKEKKKKKKEIRRFGQAKGLTPVIPTLWEAKAGKSQGQEFATSLANVVKPKNTK